MVPERKRKNTFQRNWNLKTFYFGLRSQFFVLTSSLKELLFAIKGYAITIERPIKELDIFPSRKGKTIYEFKQKI